MSDSNKPLDPMNEPQQEPREDAIDSVDPVREPADVADTSVATDEAAEPVTVTEETPPQGTMVETAAGAPSGTGAGEPTVAPVPESTIGTGTSMALGCIAGTVLLIGFGLIFLLISTFIR